MRKKFNLKKQKKIHYFRQSLSNGNVGILKASRRPVGQIKAKKRRKGRVIVLLFIILGAGLCYFLFFSHVFEIGYVVINHENKSIQIIQDQNIKDLISRFFTEKRMFVVPQTNIFSFNKKHLEGALASFGWVEKVRVTKKFPNQLHINIKEYEIFASLVIPGLDLGNLYLNSETGLMDLTCVLREASQSVVKGILCDTSELKKLKKKIEALSPPTVYDRSKLSTTDEKWKTVIGSALQIFQSPVLKAHKLSINFVEIKEEQGILLFQARTNEGWWIYLLPASPSGGPENIEEQLTNLDLALKERLQQRPGLQYIDLRFGQKIFYK